MRLYNATMKINRLEMLKANIGLELISGHDELEKFMDGILQGRTEDELKRQAGILGKSVKNNAQKAHAIVNASFHNAKFSDRIWMYQDLMKADLAKLLQSGLIQGKNPRVLARELKKTFQTSTFNAERLMRTELARVQTEAQKQSFIRNGFDEYEFIVNSGCCDICQGLSGKHFKVDKMMPGENAPPMHPHCRCSTAAYSDRKEYEEWLDFLDKGGTTEEYNKWKEQQKKAAETAQFKNNPFVMEDLPPHPMEYEDYAEYRNACAEYEKAHPGCGDLYEFYLNSNNTNWQGEFDENQWKKIKQFDSTIKKLQEDFPLYSDASDLHVGTYDGVKYYLHDIQRERLQSTGVGSAQYWENPDTKARLFAFTPGYAKGTYLDDLVIRQKAISGGKILDAVNDQSPEGYAIHEWGHAMSDYLTYGMINGNPNSKEYWEWYKTLSKDDIRKGLSDYATTNRSEFEAECFAELLTGSPRPIAQKYGEYLEKASGGTISFQKVNSSSTSKASKHSIIDDIEELSAASNDFLNKNIQGRYKPEDVLQEVSTALKKGTDRAVAILDKFADKDTYVTFDSEKSCYKGGKVHINAAEAMSDPRGFARIFFHENGHHIDHQARGTSAKLSLSSKKFGDLIRSDAAVYIESFKKKNGELRLFERISQELGRYSDTSVSDAAKYHAISDIFDGVTNGQIRGRYRHSQELGYWQSDGALEAEAFAHMFQALFEPEDYAMLQKYFPNALKEFENLIERIALD